MNKSRGEPKDGETGYTLSEMLVVLAILALLMAIVTPQVIGYLDRAKVRAARVQVQSLATTLDLFYFDEGRYPTTEEGLEALVRAPEGATNWAGPYVRGDEQITDPWGRTYRYENPSAHGGAFDLYTLGGDDREGGNGSNQDITNWQ